MITYHKQEYMLTIMPTILYPFACLKYVCDFVQLTIRQDTELTFSIKCSKTGCVI